MGRPWAFLYSATCTTARIRRSKQGGQLGVHRVDLLPCLFQLVHGGSLPSLSMLFGCPAAGGGFRICDFIIP